MISITVSLNRKDWIICIGGQWKESRFLNNSISRENRIKRLNPTGFGNTIVVNDLDVHLALLFPRFSTYQIGYRSYWYRSQGDKRGGDLRQYS